MEVDKKVKELVDNFNQAETKRYVEKAWLRKFISVDILVVTMEIIPVHHADNLEFVFHNPVESLS